MFRVGNIPWNKGLKASQDMRVKLNILKGSQTFRSKGYKTRLGIKHTEETKQKMSMTRKSKSYPAYWKGKYLSEETKKKISLKKKGAILSLEHRKEISLGLQKAGRKRMDKEYGWTRMDYSSWRKSVRERDRYQCQICFSDDKVLVAHHILPFKTHRELRYDVKNGIVLCKGCHQELHRTSLLIKKAKNSGKLQLFSNLLKALDNPEPNLDSNILEGVTTTGESQADNNPGTSLAADNKARDSLSQIAISGSNI
ncbi:MAG: NUMOD3 domain-containing DNA-binding protein [Planctomycetota bacterium]|nr:NUMOD3 domain-containing DNA-binding protein [Planctomycetota bacterium]